MTPIPNLLLQLATASEPFGPRAGSDEAAMAAAMGAGILVIALVVLLVILIPAIFYILTLQKAFTRIAPQNRELSPGLVWLLLIPLFGIVWHFIVVGKLTNSFKKEFAARGATGEQGYGYGIGLTMCILSCTTWIPLLGMLTSIGALVLWIIYWVQVAGHSGKLAR
jgi:hypothetical protein